MMHHLISLTLKKLSAPFVLLILSSLLVLSGCSPHSSTGYWQAQSGNSLNVAHINITFEGTADFYADGKEEAVYRCFWSAIAEKSIRLQCVDANNATKEETYQFINSDKNNAQLFLNDKVVGQFSQTERSAVSPKQKK